MSSRPLTPPYVPFGIRRFNRISAETRTGQGYCSILPVRVFCLRLPLKELLFPPIASNPYESFRIGAPPIREFRAESNSLLESSESSIASICTYECGDEATRPISASLSSCLLSRSSPASPGCRPSHSPSPSGHFCPDCGKSVLSVWLWLSSRTLHVLECRLHSFPSLTQNPET